MTRHFYGICERRYAIYRSKIFIAKTKVERQLGIGSNAPYLEEEEEKEEVE
jgi:hypothetical protein